jgi:hypothetical protein
LTDLSGKLDIRLRRDGDRLGLTIRSSRPVTAARVFAGRPAADVAQRLPTLFSVCATAQAHACASACEQALGLTASVGARQRRALLLQAETAKEHLWRLLLDWPQAFGAAPSHEVMARVMRAYLALRGALRTDANPFALGAELAPTQSSACSDPSRGLVQDQVRALADVAAEQVFGMSADRWRQQVQDAAALAAWSASAGTLGSDLVRQVLDDGVAGFGRNGIEPLPSTALSALSADLAGADADAFVAAPNWHGRAHETTPFARCLNRGGDRALVADLASEYGNGLLPRLAALLLELADALVSLTGESPSAPMPEAPSTPSAVPGTGIGIADAARGLLMHRVELADGLVARYSILAPTEWNFHPAGVVAAGLAGSDLARLPDDAELKRCAVLYITAVDPCVAYDLIVEKDRVPSA